MMQMPSMSTTAFTHLWSQRFDSKIDDIFLNCSDHLCKYSKLLITFLHSLFLFLFFLSFYTKFIAVMLVNKINQVSSVQLHNTPSAHCIVHPPPKVKSLSATIYPPFVLFQLPSPCFSLAATILLFVSGFFFFFFCFVSFCLIPSPNFTQPPTPLPSNSCHSILYHLFLFCLVVYVAHQIPHITEII